MTARCRMVFDGEPCTQPRAYTGWWFDCAACQEHGYLMCVGHGLCVEHAALSRTDRLKHSSNDQRADLVVMSA